MSEKKHVSARSIYTKTNVIYGLGNGLTTMRSSLVQTYRSFFLTSVLMVPAAVMGNIISISGIVNTIAVFLIGFIIQKSRPKMGRLRFWLTIGGIGAAIFMLMAFVNPGFTGWPLYIWAFIGLTGTDLFYNFYYSPYTGCVALLSDDTESRAAITGVRVQMNAIGKIIFGLINVGAIAYLGTILGSEASGYTAFAAILAILLIIGTLMNGNLIKGKESYEEEEATNHGSLPISTMLRLAFCKPILLCLGGVLAKGVCISVVAGTAAYFYTYIAGDSTGLTFYLSASTVILLLGGVLTPILANKIGIKGTILVGFAIYAIALVVGFVSNTNMVVVTICLCVGMLGQGLYHSADVAMYTDTIEYVKYTKGIDAKGFLFSLYSAIAPIGTAISSFALGIGLSMFGFNPDAITTEAMLGIRIVMFLVPVVFFIFGAICYIFLPVNDKKLEQLRHEAEEKEAK